MTHRTIRNSSSQRVFAISGLSGSGKTTLLERVIPELMRRGVRVAAVKSSNEDVLAQAGTDTRRLWEAGASGTALVGPSVTTMRWRQRLPLREIVERLDADIVIIEGMKREPIPRLWCIRGEAVPPPPAVKRIVAIVCDEDVAEDERLEGWRVVSPDNTELVANLILEHAEELR